MRRRRRPFKSPRAAARDVAALSARTARGVVRRAGERIARRGEHGAPITDPERTVLLFFEDFERDGRIRGSRHLRRGFRRLYHAATLGQRLSGFEVAFTALCTALRASGCRVVVNNHALARAHPAQPVGICGYPHILDRWTLPNPAVLGPGLFDHPAQAPDLFRDPRFHSYLVFCDWMGAIFSEHYGARCRPWIAGIDPQRWPDVAQRRKDVDFLVYDKLSQGDAARARSFVPAVVGALRERGLRCRVLRYGQYEIEEYRDLLARARAMLFLSESETQGLAYQEALCSNVPVLAWDAGVWPNRHWRRADGSPWAASSVPHFSPGCGERFTGLDDFRATLERFLARMHEFAPRAFVAEQLSYSRSAALYMDAYRAAAVPAGLATARAAAPWGRGATVQPPYFNTSIEGKS